MQSNAGDPENRICQNRARAYAPSVGRFGSRDPLHYSASPNLYEYASTNPTTLFDPFGESAYSDRVAARRAAMGLGGMPQLPGPVLANDASQEDDDEDHWRPADPWLNEGQKISAVT